MTTMIQIFENAEFGKVRTMTGAEGEALFCGKDVAEALGYKKPENAIATHVEEEDKTSTLIQGSGSNYKSKTIFINESGLYSLILSSKLESARVAARHAPRGVYPRASQRAAHGARDGAELQEYVE